MKLNKENNYSNFLLILLVLVLFGVIGYKIFDDYNVKHIIFEEQKVVRVKVEISEMEEFYKINFTNEDDMVKALTIRNKLRDNKTVDPYYEGYYGNVHFTIYDEDGRERYDEFDNVIIEDYVWELLNINSAKMQYIDVLSVNPEEVKDIKIKNPFTDEEITVKNNEEIISEYSGLEIIDSLMVAIKKDVIANPYVLNKANLLFSMTIDADSKYELNVLSDYKNILGIIKQICPDVELSIDDVETISIIKGDVTVEIEKDEFEEAKDAIEDALENYLPYTNIDSAIGLEIVLNEELGSKHIFGSINKDEVTENIYNLFE